jgi:signal transduction histidine kinase/ActR/RegA family two-component response regulator
VDFRIRHKDGSLRWFTKRGRLYRDEYGRPLCWAGIDWDITQRRRMEEDLRRLKEQAERVAKKSAWLARIPQENPDPIIRVSTDHVILYGNPAAEELYRQWGCSKRQTVPTPVQEAVAAALAGGAVSRCEISWNSHTFWLTVAPFPTQGYVTVYVKDVTERKHLEAQLQQANEHLEAQVAARTAELTRTIEQLHEEVAQRIRVEAERQKAFSELQERARQLQQLMLELSQTEDRERRRLAEILHDDLQQLLAAAKFHLGLLDRCLRTDPEAQDLAATAKDLLKQAIDQSRSLSHELSPPGLSHSDLCETFEWLAREVQAKHGLTVHLETLPRIELHSEPLKTFLYRTAQEMLFNVVKHAHAPEARLRLRRRRGRIYLSVADRGCGFDPQRAGKAGFGLRSVRERVELLGGRMRMRSAAGKGSVFVLAVPDPGPGDEATGAREEGKKGRGEEGRGGLPSALPPLFPSYPPTLLPSSSLPPPAPLRVLLVDDHRIVRQGIKAMLAGEQDLTVVGEADNGREAVDLAYRLEPHVIVMDVAMPVMAGDEAARQIRRRLPRTRIIALSMFDNARVADRMRQAGAAAYLLKTAPAEELLAAIRGREAVAPEP